MFDKKKASDINTPAPVTQNTAVPATTGATTNASAVIGPSICIQGDITGEESLVVYGKVEGKIALNKSDVTVGKTGKVTANISARIIKIEGEVIGDISGGEKVVISSTGRVRGNIVAPRMTLEDGAKFKGSIDMDPEESGASSTGAKFDAKQGTSSISGSHS